MKILLDHPVTSEPSKCSTTIQFYTFVQRTLFQEKRTDVWFYWVVPTWVTDEQFTWYPQHPQVRYLRHVRSKDRVRDYITFGDEFAEAIAFNGSFWDVDVIVTTRTMLVPLMRVTMNSPRTRKLAWTRQVWVIEDMPMMSFKETVPTMEVGVHDRMTIEGLIAADRGYVVSYHERPEIVREARRHFAPSLVKELDAKLEDVVTAQFEIYQTKKPEQMFVPGGKQRFGLAYIGRMEKANQIDEINDLMIKTWIPRGSQVYLLAMTVSRVVRTFDEKIVDVRTPNREEFWRIVQEEVHAFVKMPRGSGFSLSLIEPIMLGTPVVTVRTAMYESMLGRDYPFFADGPAQLPGIVKALYDDYAAFYREFEAWHKDWFEPTYRRRMHEDLLYNKLSADIDAFKATLQERKAELHSLEENMVVVRLAELLDRKHNGKMIRTVFDGIREMGETGELDVLFKKTRPEDRLQRSISFSTPWQPIRLGLLLFYGFADASTEVGHLERT